MTAPWSVLEIAPTDDKREVKRAYARKLKQTRPDEDSVAFQQLHEAYKFACYLVENDLAIQDDTEDEALSGAGPEVLEALHSEPEEGVGDPQGQCQQDETPAATTAPPDFQYLLDHMDALLASKNDHYFVENWKAFEQDEHLLTEDFRTSLGDAVFARVIAHWKACEEQRNEPAMLRSAVLHYLDSIFGWSNRYYDLLYGYDYSAEDLEFLNDLKDYVPQQASKKFGVKGGAALHIEEKRKTGAALFDGEAESLPFVRGLAFVADVVLLALIVYPLDLLFGLSAQYDWPTVIFTLYVVLAPPCEASIWRATPGKRLLGLQALNKHRQRLSLTHAYLRAAVLWAMVGGVTYIDSLMPIDSLTVLFAVGVFGVYLQKSKGRFLNDAASFSLVSFARKPGP